MDLVKRFDIVLVNLDPSFGSEINKVRPCVIVSPDEMNDSSLRTVIIAPMTTKIRNYPSRVNLSFSGKHGEIALDQIRTIDKKRLIKKLGSLKAITAKKVTNTLIEMFSI